MKTYKVTKLSADGNFTDVQFYINDYDAYHNAVTLNMELHKYPAHNFIDKSIREKFTADVWLPKNRIDNKDTAYVSTMATMCIV